jgi:hypothetical protein
MARLAADDRGKKEPCSVSAMLSGAQESGCLARRAAFRKNEPWDENEIDSAFRHHGHVSARLLQFFEMTLIDH